jgi:hypothetical protein
MKYILELARKLNAKHEVQYIDYDENCWTVPCSLTSLDIDRLSNDNSVSKIKLIFTDCEVILNAKPF